MSILSSRQSSKFIFMVLLLLCCYKMSYTQTINSDTLKLQAIIYNGDTIPMSVLSNIYVYAQLTEAQKKGLKIAGICGIIVIFAYYLYNVKKSHQKIVPAKEASEIFV